MNQYAILRTLLEQQQYTELKTACLELSNDTDDITVTIFLTLAHAHLEEHDLAEQGFQKIRSRRDQLDVDNRVDLASLFILRFEPLKAIALLEETLQTQPEHALALGRLGWCCMQQGDLDGARNLFEQSIAIEPDRLSVQTNLALLYLLQTEHEAAQEVIDQSLQYLLEKENLLPDAVFQQNIQLLESLQLDIWVGSEQFAAAEEWLQNQRDEDQDNYTHWLSLYATSLTHKNLHSQAEELLRDALKHDPKSIPLCLQLSDLAQVQGRFMQAAKLLKKAIKQDKENCSLWIKLSTTCLHRNDKQARKAAEKAVELSATLAVDEEHPIGMINMLNRQTKNALAQIESHEQNYDLAEQLFRELLDENKHFLPALQGLGQQQMQRGNIDEAIELFERIKQIDPVKGFSSLINARQFPEDDETLLRMEHAARLPSLEGSARSGLLYQLASAWQKRKNYDKAFELANEANEMSRRFLPYDAKVHRKKCAEIRAGFSRELYQHRTDCGVDSSLPVYVLGMPRSGTTLVEQIISGHSQIFGAGELGTIPAIAQGLNRWERHAGSERTYPACVDDITPTVSQGIANNTLEELQEYDETAKHIVDKLPHNFENIGLIKFLFPNAKIISVRRDPRDIAISNYFTDYQAKHGGMGFAYDLTDIGEQLADHNLLMHHWQQVFPGEILEINYEDVVEDLEGSARKMLDYIGVEWEPQVLEFNTLERSVKTASVWQVRQPIYKTSKAKWKRYEKHLGPLIQGTNAKIVHEPVEMPRLPEPGFLVNGVEHYRNGELDEAEMCFKKMLHHNPEHAACNYMVGLVYLSKNHLEEGIEQLEKALKKCPWHKEWRKNLIKAYKLAGMDDKADKLKRKNKKKIKRKKKKTQVADKTKKAENSESAFPVTDNMSQF